jgi:Zn-dependent protease/CBS domain-containing protein
MEANPIVPPRPQAPQAYGPVVQGPVPRRERDGRGLLLLRLFGIDVRLDWSLAIIFTLVMVNLAVMVLPSWHPEYSSLGRWVMAAVATVLMFASLLAHELSHAIVARAFGVPVHRVTLFLFGGVAHLEGEPRTAQADFFIAIIGPVTSLAIGFTATAFGLLLGRPALEAAQLNTVDDAVTIYRGMSPFATVLLWLGPLNIVLALFNLIPGYPLDGGRVLRSIFWAATRDHLKATRWATFIGRLVAVGVIAVGLVSAFGGNLVGGLWLVLIGWFLNGAAMSGFRQTQMKHVLEEVPVSRLMRTRLERLSPEVSLELFVREHVMVQDQPAYPVEENGQLVGLVSYEDVRQVPQQTWATTPVRAVMKPVSELAALRPDAAADQVLEELAQREVEQLPVMEAGKLLGLVSRADLMRWLSLQSGPRPA